MDDEIPLVREVEQLIENEKALVNLKLAEQKREAQLWKEKYDKLLHTVKETSNSDESIPFETPNTNESAIVAVKKKEISKEDLVESFLKSSFVELSGSRISISMFKEMVKLFNINFQSKLFTTLDISDCNLDDKYAEALGHIFASPRILSYDCSSNMLGSVFLEAITGSLKVKYCIYYDYCHQCC